MDAKREEMRILSDSSSTFKVPSATDQLQKLTIQKFSLPARGPFCEPFESLAGFLESLEAVPGSSAELSGLSERKRKLESERLKLDTDDRRAEGAARKEYERLAEKHNLRIAAFQLAVLLPLLAAGDTWRSESGGSVYFPYFLPSAERCL